MNSRRGGGKADPSAKGKSVDDSGQLNQLTSQMSDVNVDTQEDGWEVYGKKSKKTGPAAGRQWGLLGSSNAAPKAWVHSEGAPRQGWVANGSSRPVNSWAQPGDRRPAGRGPRAQPPSKSWETEYPAPSPVIAPPLAHGWQWASRGRPASSETMKEEVPSHDGSAGHDPELEKVEPDHVSDDDHDELDDSDDDLSDDYDSDASQRSFETRKRNKWFKGFFEVLDNLTIEEIGEVTRQWHCPACKNGPGAIDWYKGLQPLMTHAKTKGATRVRLHRELAALLEEELSRRGTSVIAAGEQYGKWKGLRETTADHEIVWPPMVVIRNTALEKDENDKWIGMGNQELLEYFRGYSATKARHAYGPRGHRGISVLIFENSAMGYMEAERLHRHFVDQRTDRDAWYHHPVLFLPGGKRQLYGFLAKKEDMENFNNHCQGKSCLRYEMKSYHEMVVMPMKQMSEDNQQLNYLKNKVVRTEQRSKVYEESLIVASQKLRETMKENEIVRRRTKKQHEEYKEEMDYLEGFFNEQIDKVHKVTEEKEMSFEKSLQEERAKARQSDVDYGTSEDRILRQEKIERFIDSQVKGVEEFEREREELIKMHEAKQLSLKREYLEKEVQLEEEFDAALTRLMEKYKPSTFQAPSSS